MSEWKDIRKDEPDIGQICLVAEPGKIIGFSQWSNKDLPLRGWVIPSAPMYASFFGIDATFWMPLPIPPPIT